MWSRFTFFVLCFFAFVNCKPQSDKAFDQIKNHGTQSSFLSENRDEEFSFSKDGKQGESINQNDRQSFSVSQGLTGFEEDENQESSTPKNNLNNKGSLFGRPAGESASNFTNMGQQHLTKNPAEFTQTSNNKKSNLHPTNFEASNQEHLFIRPTEGSTQSSHHKKHSNSPKHSAENSFNLSTEGSAHSTNHKGTDNGPSEFRPSNLQGNSFVKPTVTDHKENENLSSGFRPTNGGEQFNSTPGESRPYSEKYPTGGETYGPSSYQEPKLPSTGSKPGQNQFSNKPTEENGASNIKGDDKKDKQEEEGICFTHLGCFDMGKPWKSVLRPIGAPSGPEIIQTTIQLYSRENLENPKNITVHPAINMRGARFDPRKITAMIVHGFSNSGNATWMKDMKNVYLKKIDANVMIVDWGKGAQLLNYLQVAGNTRVVGKQLAIFVKYLVENFGANVGKFHLIGHSLGAQICSYLAKEVPGIARLTALDPAQPGFEGFDKEVRLDKSDAEFVDVIHTDARPFIPTLGFGMIAPHGHVDFYMNGGFDQPGCVPPAKKDLPSIKSFLDFAKYPVEVISKMVSCPHGRAYEYLIESFNETDNCIFWGHKADVRNVFKSVSNTVTQGLLKKFTALSTTCSKEDCIPLGFATKKSPLRGVFVVTTNNRAPYCISEPGVPPETPPQERKQESFIQKIGKRTGLSG